MMIFMRLNLPHQDTAVTAYDRANSSNGRTGSVARI